MNLEETLEEIAELAHEELHIVGKRAGKKTAARATDTTITKRRRPPTVLITTPTKFVASMMRSASKAGATKVPLRGDTWAACSRRV